METNDVATERLITAGDREALSKSHRKTLDALFAHPLAHNLEWADVLALLSKIGSVEHKAHNETSVEIGSERHEFRHPRGKDLSAEEVMTVRHFLTRVGWSLLKDEKPEQTADFLVTIDHHEARVFHLDLKPDDPANKDIKPRDPHHFLHHLAHKDQSREEGQRAAEDPAYYEQIAQAVIAAVPFGRVVVVGHGKGHSNAGHIFINWVKLHHRDLALRLLPEIEADFATATPPQLLELGRQALTPEGN